MAEDEEELAEIQEKIDALTAEISEWEDEVWEVSQQVQRGQPSLKFWLILAGLLLAFSAVSYAVALVLALLPEPVVTKATAALLALLAKLAALLLLLLTLVSLVIAALRARRKGNLTATLETLAARRSEAERWVEELERRKNELEKEPK